MDKRVHITINSEVYGCGYKYFIRLYIDGELIKQEHRESFFFAKLKAYWLRREGNSLIKLREDINK